MKDYSSLPDEKLVELYNSLEQDEKEAVLDVIMYRFHGLISKTAAPYFLVGAEREDLIQEGRIGLYEAVKSYDKSKNDSFVPFARMCVERAQIKAVTRYARKKNAPLNLSLSIDEGEGEKIKEIAIDTKVSDPQEIYIDIVDVEEKIERLRRDLSALELNVLQYMMEGYDYRQIAKIMGRADKSVDNTMQRIRKKCRGILLA